MIRLVCSFIIIGIFLPAIAQAETVGVNSGDHDGFTRLVVQFDTAEEWIFGRVDGGFELRPSRSDISYRLERVYRKIGRQRIAEVRDLGDGRLFLAVECDCHARVDELPNGQVVLDIVSGRARDRGTGVDAVLPPLSDPAADDRAGLPGYPVEAAGVESAPRAPVVVSDRAGLPLTLPQGGFAAALPPRLPRSAPVVLPADPASDAPGADADRSASFEPDPANDPIAPPETPAVERAARIAETETVLLEQVARAASQGLLEADLGRIEANVAEASPEPSEAPPPPEIERPQPPVTPRGHIAVETSVDRASAGRVPAKDETTEGDLCIDPTYFDIASWGDPVESGTDIGAYRARIVGEFDIADAAAVTALARNYVYITFGAEAQALIRRYPDSVDRADLVFAMAEIMDSGRSASAAELVDQMSCDGATALWATLAQPELRPGQAVNRDAVALAFSNLPAHLRAHLGPGLADKLLASGDRETADVIRGAIDRMSIEPTPAYGMMEAQFDLDEGRFDAAATTLDDVVAAGDASMPDALLQRVETTLARGGAVPSDIIVLLDGLAVQFRGTETARRMIDAGIRARASASDFRAAFDQLEASSAEGMLQAERGTVLRAELFELLTRNANDPEFLLLALPRLDAAATLPTDARHGVASRLLDLGLPDPARRALGEDGAMPDPTTRRLLARAALVEERPAVAIGYLAGLTDQRSRALRAAALEMAGDHAGALRAYEEADNQDMMLHAAWHGGLWPEVAARDQGAIGSAARMMIVDPNAGGGENPEGRGADQPLAAAQALIDDSAATRAVLTALLDEIKQPAALSIVGSP